MAKTYTLQSTSINPGWSSAWTDADWNDYSSAASLSGDLKKNWVGKVAWTTDRRATNILFDSSTLATLRTKTVTSIKLTLTVASGTIPTTNNYPIGYKLNSSTTARGSWTRSNSASTAASTSVAAGYIKSSSSIEANNTSITLDMGTTVPVYGYTTGAYSTSLSDHIILGTSATLVVTTNETDYSITLSYNANGGSGGPSAETKTGTASGTPSVSFTVSNTKPTRAPASAGSYTVTYNANSGSVSPASASAARTTSYTFSKWNTKSGGGGTNYVGGNTITLSSSATLYAQWTSSTTTASVTLPTPTRSNGTATYTVTYNANSGSVSPASATATKTTTYTFNKWNTKSDGSGTNYSAGAAYTPAADTTLYAQWSSSASTTSVTLPTPSRTGYTFNGWYNASSGGTKVGNAGASYTPSGNVTLYAQWTIKTYTVSYNANGGSGAPDSQTKTHGTDLTLRSDKPTISPATTTYTVTYNANSGSVSPASATATKTTTYQFSTWNTKSDGTGNSYSSGGKYTANASATLYARYTSSASTTSVALPTPTRTGYTFNGWYTAASGGTKIGNGGASYTPTANITVYAQWTIVKYTISYNANGGNASSVPDSQTKDYNESGFKLSSKVPTHANGTTTYTVTYNANEGSVGTASATATQTTTYTFSKWNTAANGSGTNYAAEASYTANANATMYAQWSSSASTTSVTLPTPSRTGYAFSGWYTKASGGTKIGNAGASYTPTATITLYAQWTKNTYTVSYAKNTTATVGNMPSNQTKTHGVDLTLSSNVPTRSGYTFKGWATSASGSVAYAAGGKYTANADIILYAVWWANKATLSTVSNTTIGSTGTATWSIPDSTYTYNLKLSYTGAADVSYDIAANTGSKTFTIPDTWLSALSNTTSATATATLTTSRDGTSLGSSTKTFTVSVGSSVEPTIYSFTATHKSSNSTVTGWATYTQGYSYARLTVSATAGTGASISSIKFSGPGINTTGTATTADTSVFDRSGTKTFTVTVTDSRGRTKSSTVPVTVYAYSKPTIDSIGTYRCDSDGTINNGSGTYVKFLPKFWASSVNSNNSVQSAKLKWRVSGGSWSSEINVTNNTYTAVLGSGNIDITKTYEVSVTVTDKLNSTTTIATLPSASGIWYGRDNDRLGLGSVPAGAGLYCDWDATFNGVVDVTKRRCYATLSSAGWYRVMTHNGGIPDGGIVNFKIGRTADGECHEIDLNVPFGYKFVNEKSCTAANFGITKIRVSRDNNAAYVDVWYDLSTSCTVRVDFTVAGTIDQTKAVASQFTPVSPSPLGETEQAEYTFVANTFGNMLLTATSRGSITYGKCYRVGNINYVNFVFTASTSATNSPQIASVDNSAYDTALSAIDITSGIGTEITSAVPCGVSTLGKIFLKEITSGHIYAISGFYTIA